MGWWTMKKKNEEWEGVLEKKSMKHGDEDISSYYYLHFRTTDGKKKKFSTPSQTYWDTWQEGEKAKKKKGEFFPVKQE